MKKEEKAWYLKAKNADSHLKEALEDCCNFEEIVVYENESLPLEQMEVGNVNDYDGAIFTCASSASRLIEKAGKEWAGSVTSFSIGPKTTARLKKLGIKTIQEAKRADYDALCQLICHSAENDGSGL